VNAQRDGVGREALFGLCVTWLLSTAPFFFDVSAFEDVSRSALAALPWIAYAGMPRRESPRREASEPRGLAPRSHVVSPLSGSDSPPRVAGERRVGIALEFALFLPALALGAWIDCASGRERIEIVTIASGSSIALVALSYAARSSARDARTRVIYGGLWFVFVVGIPVLAATLALGGASPFGPAPRVLLSLGSASPLTWVTAHFSAANVSNAIPWAPIALLTTLVASGFCARASARSEPTS